MRLCFVHPKLIVVECLFDLARVLCDFDTPHVCTLQRELHRSGSPSLSNTSWCNIPGSDICDEMLAGVNLMVSCLHYHLHKSGCILTGA